MSVPGSCCWVSELWLNICQAFPPRGWTRGSCSPLGGASSVVPLILSVDVAPSALSPSLPSSLCCLSAFVPSSGERCCAVPGMMDPGCRFGHWQWCTSRCCPLVLLPWVPFCPHPSHPARCCSTGNGVCYGILRSRMWPCLKTQGQQEQSPRHCLSRCDGLRKSLI